MESYYLAKIENLENLLQTYNIKLDSKIQQCQINQEKAHQQSIQLLKREHQIESDSNIHDATIFLNVLQRKIFHNKTTYEYLMDKTKREHQCEVDTLKNAQDIQNKDHQEHLNILKKTHKDELDKLKEQQRYERLKDKEIFEEKINEINTDYLKYYIEYKNKCKLQISNIKKDLTDRHNDVIQADITKYRNFYYTMKVDNEQQLKHQKQFYIKQALIDKSSDKNYIKKLQTELKQVQTISEKQNIQIKMLTEDRDRYSQMFFQTKYLTGNSNIQEK